MFCNACEKQIDDGSVFCKLCGAPQGGSMAASRGAGAAYNEVCEVEYTQHQSFFGSLSGTLTAKAIGPNGTYVAGTRGRFKIKDYEPEIGFHLDSLVNELVADGWQPLPGRPLGRNISITLPRFQRPAK